MLADLRLRFLLWLVRHERNGLRRERARLHAEREGIEWALRNNSTRALMAEQHMARIEQRLLALRTARRFPLRRPDVSV